MDHKYLIIDAVAKDEKALAITTEIEEAYTKLRFLDQNIREHARMEISGNGLVMERITDDFIVRETERYRAVLTELKEAYEKLESLNIFKFTC